MIAPGQPGSERFCTLNDVLALRATNYVELGGLIEHMVVALAWRTSKSATLTDENRKDVANTLGTIEERCREVELSLSAQTVEYWKGEFISGRPGTCLEAGCAIEEIQRVIRNELRKTVFMYVPERQFRLFLDMGDALRAISDKPWPVALGNLKAASDCYVADQFTACVFHGMRSGEKCLASVAKSLGLSGKRDNWQNIIEQIESAIKGLDTMPKGTDRERKQDFYSSVGIEFRYIKNAWRNHVMHSRATYDEAQAREIWWHMKSLIESTSMELEEMVED